MIQAGCEALRRYGVHTSTSRSGYGNSPLTLEVERLAAEFFGTAGAFYFASGYTGNHILIQALAERADMLLIDESAHFCLAEASRLLGLPVERFRHRNPDDLRQKLRKRAAQGQRPLVLTDGIFAVSGALAPLDQYVDILRDWGTATLLVDDAHGIGTIGPLGRGSLEQFGLWSEAVNADPAREGLGIYVWGTLSKAIGGFGGVLPGSPALLDRVRQTSHYYEGASAPMSAAAGATAKALEIVLREPAASPATGPKCPAGPQRPAGVGPDGRRLADADHRPVDRQWREHAADPRRTSAGRDHRSLFRRVFRLWSGRQPSDCRLRHAHRGNARSALGRAEEGAVGERG